jgi:hypothetical protein
MNITFPRVQAQRRVDNPKPDQFGIGAGTTGDIVTVLWGWQHNPESIPLLIHSESDRMLNISDIDVWMWLKKLSPKSRPTNATLWASLVGLFSEPGRWSGLVDSWECLTPQAENIRVSITSPFPIAGRNMSTIQLSELARWLAWYGGLTPDRVPHIEEYITCFLSKEACNPAALEVQQRMKKGTTRAAKCARTKASVMMVTAVQLDRELADTRPQSPPPDTATSAAWYQDNGLAMPDHLTTEPSLNTHEAGEIAEATPAKLAGVPQQDP